MNTIARETSMQEGDAVPAAIHPRRVLYWCLRRELWENRALTIAPVAVAGLILMASLIMLFKVPREMIQALALPQPKQAEEITKALSLSAMLLIGTMFLVAVFYCLDALHGERRDRSILFWKSLPVSDGLTLLSKACVPMLLLPAYVFVVITVTQLILLMLTTLALLAAGVSIVPLWTDWPILQKSAVLLYGLVTMTLWHAPFYGWLLVISAWAKRAPFLWLLLPPLVVAMLEKIVFGTSYFIEMVGQRIGSFSFGFHDHARSSIYLDDLAPLQFVASPGLWVGFAYAALFLYAATRLRHSREPI